jgi:hypothetical protein
MEEIAIGKIVMVESMSNVATLLASGIVAGGC